jgi:signal transduction histidine kinase
LTVRTARGAGAMVVLEVSDEGPGVPEGLVAHMFDRGVSTASSTGIGLGLARAFVEADGGRLELRRAAPPIFAIFLTVGSGPTVGGGQTGSTEKAPAGEPADATGESGTSAGSAAVR